MKAFFVCNLQCTMSLSELIASQNIPVKNCSTLYLPLPSHFRITLLSIAFQSTSIYGIIFFYACPTSILPSVTIRVFATNKHIFRGITLLAAITQIRQTLSEEITEAARYCYYLTLARYSRDLFKINTFLLKLIFFSQQIQDRYILSTFVFLKFSLTSIYEHK